MIERLVVFTLVSATLVALPAFLFISEMIGSIIWQAYGLGLAVLIASQRFWMPVNMAARQRTRSLNGVRAAITCILSPMVALLVLVSIYEGLIKAFSLLGDPFYYVGLAWFGAGNLVTLFAIPLGIRAAVGKRSSPFAAKTRALLTTYSFIEPVQISRAVRRAAKAPASSPLDKLISAMPLERAAAVLDLRARADSLRGLNHLILGFIVLVLISAALFIVFAGEIASRDTQSISVLQNARSERTAANRQLEAYELQLQKSKIGRETALARLTALDANIKLAVQQPPTKERRERLLTYREERLEAIKEHATAEAEIATIVSRMNRAEKELQDAMRRISNLEARTAGGNSGDGITATNLLVAAGITRFGVLALGIYLVQILIHLYRYNAQVAGFYLACGDTLMLGDQNFSDFGKRVSALLPDIGFGREPTGIPEKIADVLGKAMQDVAEKFSWRAAAPERKEDDKGKPAGGKED